jgi:hypothetical protein
MDNKRHCQIEIKSGKRGWDGDGGIGGEGRGTS